MVSVGGNGQRQRAPSVLVVLPSCGQGFPMTKLSLETGLANRDVWGQVAMLQPQENQTQHLVGLRMQELV